MSAASSVICCPPSIQVVRDASQPGRVIQGRIVQQSSTWPPEWKAAVSLRWLTDQELAAAPPEGLEQAQADLARQWALRLADVLEDDPGAEAELRALLDEIGALLPGSTVSAGGHSVTAGRDVNVRADHGSVGIGQLVYRQPEVAGRPVSLASRPPLLAGREELLAGPGERLSGGAGGPGIVALHGLGGAGKTSVAVEYAHRRQALCNLSGIPWGWSAESQGGTDLNPPA
jgi:hypothetical protein